MSRNDNVWQCWCFSRITFAFWLCWCFSCITLASSIHDLEIIKRTISIKYYLHYSLDFLFFNFHSVFLYLPGLMMLLCPSPGVLFFGYIEQTSAWQLERNKHWDGQWKYIQIPLALPLHAISPPKLLSLFRVDVPLFDFQDYLIRRSLVDWWWWLKQRRFDTFYSILHAMAHDEGT